MSKARCSRCHERFAQSYGPPLCRSCATGRQLPDRLVEDESPAAIERRYRQALADIRARHRAEADADRRR